MPQGEIITSPLMFFAVSSMSTLQDHLLLSDFPHNWEISFWYDLAFTLGTIMPQRPCRYLVAFSASWLNRSPAQQKERLQIFTTFHLCWVYLASLHWLLFVLCEYFNSKEDCRTNCLLPKHNADFSEQ